MYIMPSTDAHRMITDAINSRDDADVKSVHRMHIEARTFLLENINATPEQSDLLEAVQFIHEETGIIISEEVLLRILNLFSETRTKLAVLGFHDTEVKECLIDVVFQYFAGFTAPDNGECQKEGVDRDLLLDHVRACARGEGYEVDEL
ncbi:VHS1001 protein [Vibrio phage 1]|nr:VHS1001 protein [Vibrio phage 1]